MAEIPINIALEKGDFHDVVAIWSDEMASAEMYYRFLDRSFRIAATGGSTTRANVWGASPPGTSRNARLQGPVSFESWPAAIKGGRTSCDERSAAVRRS